MDSFRRFGITDKTSSLIAIKVVQTESNDSLSSPEEVVQPYLDFLKKNVDGTLTRISNETLEELRDLKVIKKNYKLPDTVTKPSQYQNAIISSISLRGA